MEWKEEDNKLVKEFEFNGFVTAVKFVYDICPLAEEMQHHPDVLIHDYKYVKVMLTTHDEGGITQKDRDLAERIDSLL